MPHRDKALCFDALRPRPNLWCVYFPDARSAAHCFIGKLNMAQAVRAVPLMSATKMCTVCRDAGRSRSDYTSHFVKDRPGGRVICPYLLSLVCSYCKRTGHTPSHCPRLSSNRRPAPNTTVPARPIVPAARKPLPSPVVTTGVAPVANTYSALMSDSDSDSDSDDPGSPCSPLPPPSDFDWSQEHQTA